MMITPATLNGRSMKCVYMKVPRRFFLLLKNEVLKVHFYVLGGLQNIIQRLFSKLQMLAIILVVIRTSTNWPQDLLNRSLEKILTKQNA